MVERSLFLIKASLLKTRSHPALVTGTAIKMEYKRRSSSMHGGQALARSCKEVAVSHADVLRTENL